MMLKILFLHNIQKKRIKKKQKRLAPTVHCVRKARLCMRDLDNSRAGG